MVISTSIQQLIGKINPKEYAQNGSELLKQYGSPDKIPADKVKPQAIMIDKSVKLEASYNLMYDSATGQLEPIYFFILDLMNSFGLNPEKLVDNFSSTPGSGHFGEFGMRASQMQQQASQIMGNVNTVLRSVLNILYDLRDFKIRLQSYDELHSDKKETSEGALLSLKQIWMDKVDIQKGNSSIKAMAFSQGGPFITLIDAFLSVKDESLKDANGKEIDLNERVKRALKPRIFEFNNWLKQSESELRKRYEIEKTYLKSQVSSLKIYSRWAKPYLKAAAELEQSEQSRSPDFVKTFNTIILELTLLGKSKIDPESLALEGEYPREFAKESYLRKFKRNYYACTLINFRFRGIPQKIQQQGHFSFGGRAEINFKAYALNDDELKKLNEEMEKSDVGDMLSLVEGITTESLDQLQEEIDSYLNEPDKSEEESKKNNDESNPFLALFGFYNKREKPKSPSESKSNKKPEEKRENAPEKITPDNWYEKEFFRKTAVAKAIETTFTIFDLYKKGNGMASYT